MSVVPSIAVARDGLPMGELFARVAVAATGCRDGETGELGARIGLTGDAGLMKVSRLDMIQTGAGGVQVQESAWGRPERPSR